jgi:crotonobetainyl-CoA:carnitine CoA-transferase CaiB-like acyl-CoA transferase
LLRQRQTAEWQERLLPVDVPCAPVWDYAQLLAQPQVPARNLKVTVKDPAGRPVDLVGTPFHIDGATLPPPSMPPALGQHTATVLRELLGLDDSALEELRRQGVV